jgi:hypothetical protein
MEGTVCLDFTRESEQKITYPNFGNRKIAGNRESGEKQKHAENKREWKTKGSDRSEKFGNPS